MKQRRPLKEQMDRALRFIQAQQTVEQSTPTIYEIGEHLGLTSSATVHSILRGLDTTGRIKRTRQWRSIEILKREKTAPSPFEFM